MQSVNEWLEALGLQKYASVFEEHEIDLEVLPDLTEADLQCGQAVLPQVLVNGKVRVVSQSKEKLQLGIHPTGLLQRPPLLQLADLLADLGLVEGTEGKG